MTPDDLSRTRLNFFASNLAARMQQQMGISKQHIVLIASKVMTREKLLINALDVCICCTAAAAAAGAKNKVIK
jgi:hypothetical protein